MMPSKGKLGCLLVFFLGSVSSVPAFLPRQSLLSDGLSLAHQALIMLVSGPLSGHDFLLVTDNHIQRLLDLDQVVEATGASFTPVLLATQHSLLHTPRPAHHTQGSLLTALLLFYQDPTDFLFLLADNTNWNPSYLVLFCLNPHLNTTIVLSQPVVQRSQFILLLHPALWAGHQHLYAYTSLPLLVSARGRPLTKAPLGVWSPGNFENRNLLFPPRFHDFGGKVMNLSTWCADEPLVYVMNDTCGGQNVDALRIIGEKYNFGFSLKDGTTDGKWGSSENGVWVGMFRDLEREGKDLVINSQPIYQDRIQAFDYTYPYTNKAYGFMLRVPPPVPQWKNIMYPFSTLIWGLLFATTVMVSTLLTLLLRHFDHVSDPINLILKISAGLVIQPMDDREVRVWWARVWLIFWWVIVDILTAAYTSNLVAVLTVPVYPKLIHTVEGMAKADTRMLMLDYGSSIPTYLRTSRNPTLAALGDKLDINPITNPDLYYDSVRRDVMSGKYALIVFGDYINFLRGKHNVMSQTYIVKETIFGAALSWYLPRHTPYTSTISDALTQLLETGVLEKLFRVHMRNILSPNTQIRGNGVLNLGHVQSAFILLAMGKVAATLALLLERLV